jgi:hypothetical protein
MAIRSGGSIDIASGGVACSSVFLMWFIFFNGKKGMLPMMGTVKHFFKFPVN